MVIETRNMAEENTVSSGTDSENDRPSSENTTIIAETFSDVPSTTLSSVTSENSTEKLIGKSQQMSKGKVNDIKMNAEEKFNDGNAIAKSRQNSDTCSKSVLTSLHSDISIRDPSERRKSKLILFFGVAQLLVGVGMVITGGLVMVHGGALGKSGAGFWSGCLAIITGVMGVLGGINDCYGLYERQTSRMGNLFLTLFLALSLVSLAAGNLAAVLAGTGLLRDVKRNEEEEEVDNYWPPILSNIGLLLTSVVHCFISLFSVYHTAKRVCSCFRPREPFNHNQFDPSYSNIKTPYSVVAVSEKRQEKPNDKYRPDSLNNDNRKELSKVLEGKLMNSGSDTDVTDGGNHNSNHHRTNEGQRVSEHMRVSSEAMHEAHGIGSYFGSANSKDRLVCSWLGGQPAIPMRIQKIPKHVVRKNKMKNGPVLLVPANAGNTLNRRVPMQMMPVSAARMGYATLPMVPAGPQPPLIYPHHGPMYPAYPINDMIRIKRKRYSGSCSPRGQAEGGRRRSNQLTRSLERIHRQRRPDSARHNHHVTAASVKQKGAKPVTEADVIRTYTGLDRTIAEQFIVACDESRHSHTGTPDHSSSKTKPGGKSDHLALDTSSSGRQSHK